MLWFYFLQSVVCPQSHYIYSFLKLTQWLIQWPLTNEAKVWNPAPGYEMVLWSIGQAGRKTQHDLCVSRYRMIAKTLLSVNTTDIWLLHKYNLCTHMLKKKFEDKIQLMVPSLNNFRLQTMKSIDKKSTDKPYSTIIYSRGIHIHLNTGRSGERSEL